MWLKAETGLAGLVGALLLASCAGTLKTKSVSEVIAAAEGEAVEMGVEVLRKEFDQKPPYGYEPKYSPMLKQPETLLVWIYPRKEADAVYLGHYMVLRLTDFEWSDEIVPAGRGDGGGGEASPVERLPHYPSKEGEKSEKGGEK